MIQRILNIVVLAIVSQLILADDPCKFTTSDGVIDISSVGNTDGTPTYKDIQPAGSGFKYSFNPCKPFTEGKCVDASVCQVDSNNPNEQFMLGTQGSAQWTAAAGAGSNPTLKFSHEIRTVLINLFCPAEGEGEIFEFVNENPGTVYNFNWKNKCLCPNGCKGVNPPSGGSTNGIGGVIFIALLFGGLFVYFVVFALINKFGRHQTGLEIFPHRGFWFGLPGYTKDGVLYIVHRVTGKGANYQSV